MHTIQTMISWIWRNSLTKKFEKYTNINEELDALLKEKS